MTVADDAVQPNGIHTPLAEDEPTPRAYVSARCAIDVDDVLSRISLMTVSFRDQLIITCIHLLPAVLLSLFVVWQVRGWRFEGVGSLSFYKPKDAHESDASLEYTMISIMFGLRMLPRIMNLVAACMQFYRFCGMWGNSDSSDGRMLFNGMTCILMDKLLLPIATLLLSWFVAFFNSETLMQVLWRLLWFEFLQDLDIPIIKEYIKFVYPAQCMRIDIDEVVFKKNYWVNSDVSEKFVVDALLATDEKTSATQLYLTLMNPKRGLGISPLGGTTCQLRISIQDTNDSRSFDSALLA